MASNARATLDILVDAGQANQSVDQLKGKVGALGEAGGMAGGKVIHLSNAVGGMQPKVEKAATAVSGMASVMGGMGQKTGAALGAVSNMAAAFVTGGPFLAGVALAATAISGLAGKWIESRDAAAKAREESQKAVTSIVEEIVAANDKLRAQIDTVTSGRSGMARGVAELKDALALVKFQLDETNAAAFLATGEFNNIAEAQSAVEVQTRKLDAEYALLWGALGDAAMALEENVLLQTELDAIEQQNAETTKPKVIAAEKAKAAALDASGARLGKVLELERARKKAERDAEIERDKNEVAQARAGRDAQGKALAEDFKHFDQDKKARLAASAAAEAERVRIAEDGAKARTAAREAEIDAEMAGNAAAVQTMAMLAQSSINMALSGIEALAAGQDDAVERMALGMLRFVGDQLIAFGISGISRGVIESTNPLAPGSGAAMIAAGAAAVAAGGAMSGASAVGSGLLSRGNGGGGGGGLQAGFSGRNGEFQITRGGGGGAGPNVSGRAPSRRGASDLGGGGATHVSYVFNAPVLGEPSTAAREVARLQQRAENELFAGGN